jgi:hypothetical protein
MAETIAALGPSLANLESPDLEALMAATKETYKLYDDGMAWLKRYLDALPGGDFTGISSPVATLQDAGDALGTALDMMAEAAATGTVDCDIPAR